MPTTHHAFVLLTFALRDSSCLTVIRADELYVSGGLSSRSVVAVISVSTEVGYEPPPSVALGIVDSTVA